jgi:hypothetical protein
MVIGCLNKRKQIEMKNNLFSDIFKYRQSKNKTPLENYCTEIFVYIFRQLIESKNLLAFSLLELFGFGYINKDDLDRIEIITQETHYINNGKVIPDIIIKYQKKINVIEVKVNSGLRYYKKSKTKYIDQIERYKEISNINDVFLLSKNVLFSKSLKNINKILWSQIHSILLKSDNEIINNFALYLEENGMKSSIVNVGAENGINSIYAIMNLIEKSWDNEKFPLEEEVARENIGFYFNNGKAWIGQIMEMNEYLVFELLDDRLIKKTENLFKDRVTERCSNDCFIFSKIKLYEITSYKTEREQQERLQKWFKEEVNIVFEKQKTAYNKR